MTILLTILASLLVFGAVIAVHEFGHFAAAKLSGIQVNEFAIGMGPALWKKIAGGTQYTLRLLPVGGSRRRPSGSGPLSWPPAP